MRTSFLLVVSRTRKASPVWRRNENKPIHTKALSAERNKNESQRSSLIVTILVLPGLGHIYGLGHEHEVAFSLTAELACFRSAHIHAADGGSDALRYFVRHSRWLQSRQLDLRRGFMPSQDSLPSVYPMPDLFTHSPHELLRFAIL